MAVWGGGGGGGGSGGGGEGPGAVAGAAAAESQGWGVVGGGFVEGEGEGHGCFEVVVVGWVGWGVEVVWFWLWWRGLCCSLPLINCEDGWFNS